MSTRVRAILAVVLPVSAVLCLAAGMYWWQKQREISALADFRWRSRPGGVLILYGGGSVPSEVHDCFVRCAGGNAAKIVVIPAFQAVPADLVRLAEPFATRSVAGVEILNTASRAQADDDRFSALLAAATGVWISGGDQWYLSDVYAGTAVERQLHDLLARGGVIAGTSAGAAAMTRVMIRGEGVDATRRGFDLLPNAIVDQHFFQRNRTQRLLAALAEHPHLVGLGIDEGTAIVAEQNGTRWTVMGRSYAMVCVPSETAFPRIEILKAGESTNIDYLREVRGITAISSPGMLDEVLGDSSER